jgi:hypothetical protein
MNSLGGGGGCLTDIATGGNVPTLRSIFFKIMSKSFMVLT